MRRGREGEGKGRRAACGRDGALGWGTRSARRREGLEDLRWSEALRRDQPYL